jgi:hypothetical protein
VAWLLHYSWSSHLQRDLLSILGHFRSLLHQPPISRATTRRRQIRFEWYTLARKINGSLNASKNKSTMEMGLMPKHWPLNSTIVTSLFSIFGSGSCNIIVRPWSPCSIWRRMKPNKQHATLIWQFVGSNSQEPIAYMLHSRDIAHKCKETMQEEAVSVQASSGRI